LIEVIDKQPETTIPYEDVKDRLEQYMKQEKIQEEVRLYAEKLKEKANVERFLTESQ
jgi:parvulin-like peptidyl-prolyl isomerase